MNTKELILVIDNGKLKDRILKLLFNLKYEVSIKYINTAEQYYNTTERVIAKSKDLYKIHNLPVIVVEESIEKITSINNSKTEIFKLICASFYSGSINTAFECRIEDASDYEILDEFICTKLEEYYSEYLLPRGAVEGINEIVKEALRVRKFREILNPKKKKSNVIEFKKSPKRVLSKGSI